jgi:hypothetical protein
MQLRSLLKSLLSIFIFKEYADEIHRLREELNAKRETDGIPYAQYL